MTAPSDEHVRCAWSLSAPEFLAYHDDEWGMPVGSDQRLFEKLCLEGFQSGLSWRTILAKRENFRAAFANFDFEKVASFTAEDVERLMKDAGIVRHRGKIEAAIHNAARAMEMVEKEGSIAKFVWGLAAAGCAARAAGVDLGGLDCALEGAEEARVEVRWANDRVRVHAGDGARERSPCELLCAGAS